MPTLSSLARALGAMLVLAGLSPIARAAPVDDQLAAVEEDIVELGFEVETIRVNFTARSGLIGAADARMRYEDSVYSFLMEEFDGSAISFYILVQSNALINPDLARDSEWFLAESLFELGNYRTAEEAYRLIVEKGAGHPYFPDAVRRSMETFSILGDTASFDRYYNEFIVTNRVPPTDLIHYTLAKSFYRRGESGRAKAEFEQVSSASPLYSRARYFLATMMVTEKNYAEAIAEMERVGATAANDEDQKRVAELANIALARLYYETGDFTKASEFYARITRESDLHADELYESVWTYIKQERWEDALSQVKSFLETFPQHRYSASMRILQGHLYMKLKSYGSAEEAYAAVVSAYNPLVVRLRDAGDDPAALRQLLGQLTREEADTSIAGLPGYATDLLVGREEVGRAVGAWSTLAEQREELELARQLLERLQAALATQGEILGTFSTARAEVGGVRGSTLTLRDRLIDIETAYLRARVATTQREAVLDVVRGRAELAEDSVDAGDETRAQALLRYNELRNRLRGLRGGVTDATAAGLWQRIDALWSQVDAVDQEADRALQIVDASEAREIAAVRQRVEAQAVRVKELESELGAAVADTEATALAALDGGVAAVARTFEDDVILADKGIVDVYWLRKTSTSDQMEVLNEEQQRLLRELDERFRVIRENANR